MVTASLEGTKATRRIEWDYGKDLVMIEYDGTKITPEKLGQEIAALGYRAEPVSHEMSAVASRGKPKQMKVLIPQNAPEFFRDAFAFARREQKPVVVDFWARWCGPCKRLKEVTFSDEKVARLLAQVQLIFVDLDQFPELGDAYAVASVPDVFLIDRDGVVVDRVQNFEAPAVFAERLLRLLGDERSETEAADHKKQRHQP